jgi:nucleotide-binding universal stress UspA family protein
MPITPCRYPDAQSAQIAAFATLDEARADGKRGVLLTSSFDAVLRTRRLLAREHAGFGATVTTVAAWTEDLWSLHGDGTNLIDRDTRELIVHHLLASDDFSLSATDGVITLINELVSQALPYIDSPASLSSNEAEAVRVARAYAQRIHARGLIEPCEAQQRLATCPVLDLYAPVMLDAAVEDLGPAAVALLDAADTNVVVDEQSIPCGIGRADELEDVLNLLFRRGADDKPVTPTGAVRFALAAGPTATKRLISDTLADRLAEAPEGSIVIASKNPRAQFDFSIARLQQKGISCRLQNRVKFSDTDMGRALIDLFELVYGDTVDAAEAADFMFNPLSGTSAAAAFFSDKKHREDRLIDGDCLLFDVASHASEQLQGVVQLLIEHDTTTAFDCFQASLDKRFGAKPAYRAEQSRALQMLRETCEQAARLEIEPLTALHAVQSRSIRLDAATEGDAQVRFMTLDDAAQLDPASVDTVIIADLNSTDYTLRVSADAVKTLLGKYGLAPTDDPLARARTTFYRAFQAARRTVVLQRTLNDETTAPLPPATMFVEVIDCYRARVTESADMEKTLGITQNLLPYSTQRGEQHLEENAVDAAAAEQTMEPLPPVGTISNDARPLIVLPRSYNGGLYYPGMDLSASQIESYLECPYQWFAKRRLKLETIDEGFSNTERGSFVHAVMKEFYVRFQNEVQPKVDAATLPLARTIMEKAFASIAQHQFEMSPDSRSRYVPVDAWERQVRDGILPKLIDYLDCEAQMLPSFAPRRFEWQFGSPAPTQYANCNLTGAIDRIDVDERGRAVIIDYKSSLSDAYRLHVNPKKGDPIPDFVLPRKMQALIYGMVVHRELGLDVVGAIYLNPFAASKPALTAVEGALDTRIIGQQDFPFAKKASIDGASLPFSDIGSFAQLLDRGEDEVSRALARLAQGDIMPKPTGKEACEYCPVRLCTHRIDPKAEGGNRG